MKPHDIKRKFLAAAALCFAAVMLGSCGAYDFPADNIYSDITMTANGLNSKQRKTMTKTDTDTPGASKVGSQTRYIGSGSGDVTTTASAAEDESSLPAEDSSLIDESSADDSSKADESSSLPESDSSMVEESSSEAPVVTAAPETTTTTAATTTTTTTAAQTAPPKAEPEQHYGPPEGYESYQFQNPAEETPATTTAETTTTTSADILLIRTKEVTELLAEINGVRKENGLPALNISVELSKAAYVRCEEIQDDDWFGHVRPNGQKSKDYIREVMNGKGMATENIAMGFENAHEVMYYEDERNVPDDEKVYGWMYTYLTGGNHKKNILSEYYDTIGIAFDAETETWVTLFYSTQYESADA